MKYEEILERVGSFGRYQKCLCLLVIYAGIPNAFVTFMFVFNHHVPEFRCKIPRYINFTDNTEHIPSIESLYNATIPWIIDEFGNRVRSSCEMYNSTSETVNKSEVIPCRYGYQYDASHQEHSAATEFDLVCENGWKRPFVVSIFMAGMMAGSTLGYLSDRFGRRCIFLFSTLVLFLSVGLSGFAWNFESYTAGCFFCGTGTMLNYVVTYVLSLEMVSPRHRNLVGIINNLGFSLGGLLVPLLGYFLRNWRWYQWAASAIGVLYIPLYWVTPESARWLIMSGKEEEAKTLLSRMAKVNGRKVNVDDIFEDKVDLTSDNSCKYSHVNIKKESSLRFVLRHAGLRPRFYAMYFGWFVCALIYFAISLNPANLSGDRFINTFLVGLVEFPALFVAYYSVNFGGVPRCFLLFMTITGISCIVAPFLTGAHSAAVTIMVVISKGAVTAVYHVIYLGTLEISPTLVRNTATSLGSFMSRLGSIVSPYLIYAGSLGMIFLPYVIMGVMAITCGLFGILFLPENNGIPMPDTSTDALNNERYYRLNICKKFVNEDIKTDIKQGNTSSRMI